MRFVFKAAVSKKRVDIGIVGLREVGSIEAVMQGRSWQELSCLRISIDLWAFRGCLRLGGCNTFAISL